MTQFSVRTPKQLGQLKRLAEQAPTAAPWVECGVLEGGSAELLYAIAQARGTKLHLFDTFNGQPTYESTVDPHRWGTQRSEIDEYGIRALMAQAEVHIGIFPEILDYCDDQLQQVALVHIDFAAFAGTYEAGRIFMDRLIPGGVMFFPDFDRNDAVAAAIRELGIKVDEKGVYRHVVGAKSPDALPGNVFAQRPHKRKLAPRRQGGPNVAA